MTLYNSLTRTKEILQPITQKRIKIYVCGITPYDTTHLGHAFTYISFDVLIRYLQYLGYSVEYTQNVTDIDDDILKRAAQEKKNWKKLGEFWTKKFLNDMETLNISPPTHYVKATESMETIILMTQTLEKKGVAYEKKGNVYFRTKTIRDYGKLSRLTRSQMLQIAKERGGHPDDRLKEDPLDFILWQKSHPKDDQLPAAKSNPPYWKSPWGKGRPGWHIECSSMIYDYLGEQIDIHGGGRDLIYPHHESEIAQSESFTDKKPFAKKWMHTAMLMHEGEKMSKSLGNLIMVSDLLKKYSPNSIRYVLLSHHYRKPWEFDESELIAAESTLESIRKLVTPNHKKLSGKKQNSYLTQFKKMMEDDLNTPEVIELINKLSQKIVHARENESAITALKTILPILGFT